MVHLRQLLTASGIALDRMMDDWGQPVDTVGEEGPGIPDCDAPTQETLDQASATAAGINLP